MNANPAKRNQGKSERDLMEKSSSNKRKPDLALEELDKELQKKLDQVKGKRKNSGFLDTNIDAKSFLKWLYDANPFYLISTCLILYAQTLIFQYRQSGSEYSHFRRNNCRFYFTADDGSRINPSPGQSME